MHFQLFVQKFLAPKNCDIYDLTIHVMSNSIIMKFLRQSRQGLGQKIFFLKHKSDENRKPFCKQRNKCVSLWPKSKKYYFPKLNEKNITITKLSGKPSSPSRQKNSVF